MANATNDSPCEFKRAAQPMSVLVEQFVANSRLTSSLKCSKSAHLAALPHGLRASQSSQVGGVNCRLAICSDSSIAIVHR
jgi:hypothetical protein